MNQDTMQKIALTIVAYRNLKGKMDIPGITTGQRAIEIVKEEIRAHGWPEVLAGNTKELVDMAETLKAPKNEYLDFCEEIAKQLKEEKR